VSYHYCPGTQSLSPTDLDDCIYCLRLAQDHWKKDCEGLVRDYFHLTNTVRRDLRPFAKMAVMGLFNEGALKVRVEDGKGAVLEFDLDSEDLKALRKYYE
jgi:hypothetical protein